MLLPLFVQSQNDTMCGKAVHTFNSVNNMNIQSGPIGAIYDTRNFSAISAGSHWSPINSFIPSNWYSDSIGPIFPIAIDNFQNVYLGTSRIYSIATIPVGLNECQIYKCSPPTYKAIPFCSLPCSVGGGFVGDIVFDKISGFVFASSLEDGKIYKINNVGAIISSYDPFLPDNGTNGICPQNERIYGLGINYESGNTKLYFARISSTTREMYSLPIDGLGNFPTALNSEVLEISNLCGSELIVSDLAFNCDGTRMLIAERGYAHGSQVFLYHLSGGVWTFGFSYFISTFPGGAYSGQNSAGGIDFGTNSLNENKIICDSKIWATGNYLMYTLPTPSFLYGIQGINSSGNNVTTNNATDIFVNSRRIPNSTGSSAAKGFMGDVELFDCECDCQGLPIPILNCCDSVIIYKTDSCCSHLESTCEVKSINISVANGTISDLFWNCGTIPPGYLGSTNFTYTPTVACPLALDICVNANGLNPVTITYNITFIDSSLCTKTETKNCACNYVSGVMWHDLDNDGINETGEPALVGYTVNLIDCATGNIIMFTPTTSPNGSYSFSCMPPGKYYVQFVPPLGYEPSPFNTSGPTTDSDIDHLNGTYNTDKFMVNNGDTIQNLDAGLFNCCDFVLIEETNDSCCSTITSLCAVDSIKVNVQNGTISLISWNCAPRLNNYAYSGLSNFTLGIPNNCPLSFGVCVDPIYTNPYAPVIITYTVYSSSGAVCTKYDTLFCPCAVITGEAWYDANGDGINQQIENGINGMLIQLVDAMTGKTVSTMETITRPGTSSDDGYYEFPCVKPGMYYIRFDSLAGFTTSTPFQGGNAETDSDITGTYGPYTTYKITVMNGDTINNIDGGYKDSTIVSIGHLTIAGLIISETTKAMLPSRVNLATANNSNYKTEWSHYSGNYAFTDLISGQDYRISVENNDAPLQGVSTRDIVLIQKHILGIKYLDSPYKIIAADVNNSQSITASDLAEIRKLILGAIETYPKNKSWRFIPKNYVFKNPAYPFPFEENILHSKMENNKMNTDFYAVKIGDVSGNALGLVNTTIRTVKNVQLFFEKASYKKNEEISVPVRISESDMLSGIQIALQCSDELEFVTIEKGSLNINQENYRFNRGQLLISYNDAQGFDVGKKDIFTLKLKAKTDLNIDNKIRSSNSLENEAYDLADQVVPLEVISSVENIKTTSGVYKFYPAKPNPFKQETMIEFELPNEEAIIFTVYNPEGKLLWSKEKMYISGNNQMSISKEDLGHSGLYYLHIQSKEFCKTQRILMLD